MKIYLLILNNGGEYDDEIEVAGGVFSTRELAQQNSDKAMELFGKEWSIHNLEFAGIHIREFDLDKVVTDYSL